MNVTDNKESFSHFINTDHINKKKDSETNQM